MRLVLRNDLFLKGSVAYNGRAKWETTFHYGLINAFSVT